MSTTSRPVLVTWLAIKTDPFERTESGGPYRKSAGRQVLGPTLTLLTDSASPYAGRIHDIVVLRQRGKVHEQVLDDLADELEAQLPTVRIQTEVWDHRNPTDHAAIYEFLRGLMPRLRQQYANRELLIHLSPGTPAMHTVWVLMAETGYIEPPYTAVQSIRAQDRHDGPAVAELRLGLDTFFKRWRETRPLAIAEAGPTVQWDPRQFQSAALREVYDDARRISRLRVPVLILGERGTGKTTLASWIRFRSPFRKPDQDRHWPTVPCGQYAPETMRAELFGYVKGAFTGASKDHDGLLKAADGDTLFLDEIGDTSRDVQRLLIKALEEGHYQPLGGAKPVRSSFRLLSATNVPLDELRDRLDPDFFDRIAAFRLVVPPLRAIPEELEWLWPTVLAEAARRAGALTRYAKLNDAQRRRVVAALRAHRLPGNVRDLFRVAWRFLAARSDDDAPMTVRQAIDYGLEALDPAHDLPATPAGGARALARAFAEQAPLSEAMLAEGPLDGRAVVDEFKPWFAAQISGLAERSGLSQEKVSAVPPRTLSNWRKKSTGVSE